MKRLIAIAASIAVNAVALGVIAAGILQTETPAGHVYVTELPVAADVPVYAQAQIEPPHAPTAL